MHYYIDGYNLLFRYVRISPGKNFEAARNKLIVELDERASHLSCEFTVVFDAPLQNDELKRGHFRSLEIIFSASGQSADDLLIEIFKHHPRPRTLCLVTSDRDLQKRAKLFSVTSQSIEEFMRILRKRENKKQQEKAIPPKKTIPAKKISPATYEKSEQIDPSTGTEGDTSLLSYKVPSVLKTKIKKKQKEKTELPEPTDYPKWQTIFEKELNQKKPKN